MATSADALRILQSLVRRSRTARVSYGTLLGYAEKYLARAADEDPSLEDFADNPANFLTAYLVDLEKKGQVVLSYSEDAVTTVVYPRFYVDEVEELYDRIDDQPDRPFPGDEALSTPIPPDRIHPVDVKTDFVRWLARAESMDAPVVLRLMFPDGVNSMLVSSRMLSSKLPKLSVQKLRQYLRSERNASYMRSKLSSIFRQREVAMKDMLANILTTPDQALKTVFVPTDFTFHFWTQLSSTLIKEYSQKKDKLVEEHGHCQAAYLIGYYNVHHRGVQQRARERETALRQLENRLRQSPYTFTISDIHGFTDQRGVALTRKYSLDDVNSYVADRIKPSDDRSLPQMIRVRSVDGKEYYLYREFVPHVTVEHVFAMRRELRDHFVDTWKTALQRRQRPPEMGDEQAFEKVVEAKLRESDPLLHTLLNYNLLFLARKEGNAPSDLAAEVDELFHPREPRLRPLSQILNLDRKKLATDAKLLLPFWQAVPVVSAFVTLLKRLFMGLSEEERLGRQERRRVRRAGRPSAAAASSPVATTVRYSPDGPADDVPHTEKSRGGDLPAGFPSSASRRAQMARYKEAVRDLQREYVHPGSTPEKTLSELAERWNPLLDQVAKEHLVEDINSLARDFLRRMKISFRLVPPTRERVNEWADRLCRNEAFAQIRRTDDLKEYLKLYMLTILGK